MRNRSPDMGPVEDRAGQVALLTAGLFVLLLALILFSILSVLVLRSMRAAGLAACAVAVDLGALLLARGGRLRAAGALFCLLLWALLTAVTVGFGGTDSAAFFGYTVLVVVGYLTLPRPWPPVFTVVSLATALAAALAQTAGRLPAPLGPNPPVLRWAAMAVYTSLGAVLLRAMQRRRGQALESIRRDQAALREAERQVLERAARLDLLARLGQAAAGLPQPETLLRRVAGWVAETFGYRNVVIFLLEGAELVMRACTLPEAEPLVGTARLPVGAGSICGWAAQTGLARRVADTRREPLYRALVPGAAVLSEMAIPMRITERVVGVLDVQALEPDAFQELDLRTLQTVADQIAISIENARLHEETRRRAERLSIVNRIGRAAGSTLEMDRLLERLFDEVSAALPCDAFFVAVYDEAAEMLDYRIQIDGGMRAAPERAPIGRGFTSQVIASRRPLLVTDFERQKDRLPVPVIWGTMRLPESWLGVPMLIGERISGVISVQAYRPHAYSEEDVQLLATLADQASVAIENARLYEAMQEELSERKRLEGELVQAQKMEAIGRLAGGVAHDFNNLLTSIGGCVELLKLEDGCLAFAEQLDTIKAAVRRGAGLTRQLLALSRRQVLKPAELDLNVVLGEAEKLLRPLLGRDVELVCRPADALGRVKADAGQILQVIINLAVNARDAMPDGGRLTLETANVDEGPGPAGDLPPGPCVMLAVHDSGTGIGPEVREHLFEPFFTTKAEGKGTGLGLATVDGIIRQSGGAVTVDSSPGAGSSFRVYLPRLPDR